MNVNKLAISTGADLKIFLKHNCNLCTHEDPGIDTRWPCPILKVSMCDGGYPDEWIREEDGGGRCVKLARRT